MKIFLLRKKNYGDNVAIILILWNRGYVCLHLWRFILFCFNWFDLWLPICSVFHYSAVFTVHVLSEGLIRFVLSSNAAVAVDWRPLFVGLLWIRDSRYNRHCSYHPFAEWDQSVILTLHPWTLYLQLVAVVDYFVSPCSLALLIRVVKRDGIFHGVSNVVVAQQINKICVTIMMWWNIFFSSIHSPQWSCVLRNYFSFCL